MLRTILDKYYLLLPALLIAAIAGYVFFFRAEDASENAFVHEYDISRVTVESITAFTIPDTYNDAEKASLQPSFEKQKSIILETGLELPADHRVLLLAAPGELDVHRL